MGNLLRFGSYIFSLFILSSLVSFALIDGVVPENIHIPPPLPTKEGTFALNPHTLEFPFQGVLVITPTPGISVIFHLVGYPLERIFVSKMYAKDICSAIK